MSTPPSEDRFTLVCPRVGTPVGPYSLPEVAELLAQIAREGHKCSGQHIVELIEVSNDE